MSVDNYPKGYERFDDSLEPDDSEPTGNSYDGDYEDDSEPWFD